MHLYYKNFLAVVILFLTASGNCNFTKAALLDTGVSQELAQYRKENFGQIRYHLFFSVPEKRQDSVTGTAELILPMKKARDIIIDFRGNKEQISSVTLNSKVVSYVLKNEHILINAQEVSKGENHAE